MGALAYSCNYYVWIIPVFKLITMNKQQAILYILSLTGILYSCCNPSNSITMETDFEEHAFAVRLVEDSSMVEKYLNYHKNVWPEVEAGFKKAGYDNIQLYRFENYITMIVKVPKGSDLGQMGQISNDSHPRVAEWNKLMDGFQKGLPGTLEGQTWVEMDKYYEYKNN